MTTIREASDTLSREYVRSAREGDGWPTEADEGLNGASRALVHSFNEHGEAWLANINRGEVLWRWDGSLLYNFGADLVLPCQDAELERLISEYRSAPWDSRNAMLQIKAIHDRCYAVGGKALVWT